MKELRKYSKYLFLGLVLAVFALSFILIKPYITAILSALVLTYIFYPYFKFLNKYIPSKEVCSLLVLLSLFFLILIPLFFIISSLISQAAYFYDSLTSLNLDVFLSNFSASLSNFLGVSFDINIYIQDIAKSLSSYIAVKSSEIILSLPQMLLSIFLTAFLMFYLFVDAERLLEKIRKILPMPDHYKTFFFRKFNSIINATVYGIIVTAIIQGVVGTIGLIIFDVSSPILLGLLMIVVAILPYIGTALIWLPIALFKIFQGDYFNGFGLLIYGAIITSNIDNIIKPRIISSKAKVHPVITILGVFGGLSVFGFLGLILGPLIIALLVSILKLYIGEKDMLQS